MSGKSKNQSSAAPCSESIGQVFPDGQTCEHFPPADSPGPTLFAAGLHASEPAKRQPSAESEQGKRCGRKCSESSPTSDRDLSSSNSRRLGPVGKNRLRVIWRALATEFPDYNDRLAIVARLIAGGECSLLPTPCKSDGKRGFGSESHPRLSRARGLRLQEELGVRPGPAIVEWMMGFPIGWTDLKPLAMPLFPQ